MRGYARDIHPYSNMYGGWEFLDEPFAGYVERASLDHN
jgi:hypothetical protein